MNNAAIPDVALIDNNSQRLPCVLLLDGSGSMSVGGRIQELNAGLKQLETELKRDDIASQRVQLLVIQFNGDDDVEILTDWTDAMSFSAPKLEAAGRTPMGRAVRLALQKLEHQKAQYRSHGITYNRPWVFLITDGYPTDDGEWESAAAECKAAETAGKLSFFGIGVGDAVDLSALAHFSSRPPALLKGLAFKELFVWLSRSVSSASKSAQGATVDVGPTDPWRQVSA